MKLLGAIALCAATAACGTHGLSFKLDERIAMVSPTDHATVTVPLTVRWTEDDSLRDTVRSYGVLVDRTPPPAGKTLAWLFRNDDSCGTTGCPDSLYRAQRGVLSTEATSVVLTEVATRGERNDGQGHEVTVILLDGDGRRVGEGAWSRQFTVERPS